MNKKIFQYYVDNYFKFKGSVDDDFLEILLDTKDRSKIAKLMKQREVIFISKTDSWAVPVVAENSDQEEIVQENIKNIQKLLVHDDYKFDLVEMKNTNDIFKQSIQDAANFREFIKDAECSKIENPFHPSEYIQKRHFYETMLVVLQKVSGCDLVSVQTIPFKNFRNHINKDNGFSEDHAQTVSQMVSGDSFIIYDRTIRISVV
ncbi:MAG: hypothetical protein U9R16_05335 [Campylobacterota bacterium]|nr:hypothetical protein [Campylobacterota bacterium]